MNETRPESDVFQVEAHSSIAENLTRILKHGDSFGLFDRFGDVSSRPDSVHGIFHEGSRFLSRSELRISGVQPLLLSSTVKKDNLLLAVDLTNPELHSGTTVLPHGSLHLFRSKFLYDGACYERFKVTNYGLFDAPISLDLGFDADFLDVFELRGQHRERRGRLLPQQMGPASVLLRYQGLDHVLRRTMLQFSIPPDRIVPGYAEFRARLAPGAEIILSVLAIFSSDAERAPAESYDDAFSRMMHSAKRRGERHCRVITSNIQFNQWLERATSDLEMMLTDTEWGPYPYAGVPWYSTVFGRDGIITALEMLWVRPEVARGVLNYLAAHQARASNDAQDSDPGKILHETRQGEMAALREIPFWRYYGSIDSTPLFLVLAGAYYQRTGDADFINSIWDALLRASEWLERFGDPDRDGFLEYHQRSVLGLLNQGWKDSKDSVFGADGVLAKGAIALCEVQGYSYAARIAMEALHRVRGESEAADANGRAARTLRESFERSFWSDTLGTYVLGLDGAKQPLAVRASNAGHALYSGIALPAHAQSVAECLMSPRFFSGWGVRTLAAGEPRYNPMSYHNGSVWPHDNALIASGLSRYGFRSEVLRILEGMFDAARFVELHRLPELFCGFVRRPDEAPTLYPVACSPQAWAAGSVFMLIESCLGLSIHAGPNPRLHFSRPALPAFLQEVRIENLQVADACVDLSIRRYRDDIGVHVLSRSGALEITVTK
ncbi:MAG: amylo-alpha-1,6-glucosidase [Acidiferrobacteraceae bacterium]